MRCADSALLAWGIPLIGEAGMRTDLRRRFLQLDPEILAQLAALLAARKGRGEPAK